MVIMLLNMACFRTHRSHSCGITKVVCACARARCCSATRAQQLWTVKSVCRWVSSHRRRHRAGWCFPEERACNMGHIQRVITADLTLEESVWMRVCHRESTTGCARPSGTPFLLLWQTRLKKGVKKRPVCRLGKGNFYVKMHVGESGVVWLFVSHCSVNVHRARVFPLQICLSRVTAARVVLLCFASKLHIVRKMHPHPDCCSTFV